MGKWKYVNGLVIVVIMGFMYRYFAVRYEASLMVYVISTAGILVTAVLGHYIFVYKMQQKPGNTGNNNTGNNKIRTNTERPQIPAGGRPRVVLKKGRNGK